jgi:hypothetical protein
MSVIALMTDVFGVGDDFDDSHALGVQDGNDGSLVHDDL